jgi:hypothetical protein
MIQTHSLNSDRQKLDNPSRDRQLPGIAILLPALVFGLLASLVVTSTAQAHGRLFPHTPDEWLAHEGFYVDETLCGPGGYRIEGADLCSHGPDAAPPGFDPEQETPPVAGLVKASAVICEDDGLSGKRVQVLYLREEGKPDRYDQYVESIRQWTSDMDEIFAASARLTGGHRRVRFVTDPDCQLAVPHVVVPAGATATFRATITALIALGYSNPDRKYVAFVDARVYCGIATIISDSNPTPANRSNHQTGYARVDNGCWAGSVAAHELVHTLGGVQPDAPNASGGWHCVDEFDLMCYSDEPFYPSMKYLCPLSYATLLDCNHDDYFHTNPPAGSYLADHWNVADSEFLIIGDPEQNQPPTIDRLLHSGVESLTAPATLTFTVEASDVDGAITRVEFYEGDNLLHQTTAAPYTFVWQAIPSGTYTVTIVAHDDMEGSTQSEPLVIVVAAPPAPPDDADESDQENEDHLEDELEQEEGAPRPLKPTFLPYVVRG